MQSLTCILISPPLELTRVLLKLTIFHIMLGCIFHIRLSTSNNLDHAMLYSISVNLPAHRADQLDRVLVAASPINDINLYAWDINRVRRFIELDIGIRMELCHSCYRGRSMNITFILEKQFVKDCVDFLCKEAQIIGPPIIENGLLIYNIDHKCSYRANSYNIPKKSEVPAGDKAPPIPPRPPKPNGGTTASVSAEKSNSEVCVCINNSADLASSEEGQRSRCFTTTSVDVMINRESPNLSKPLKPVIPIPEVWDDYTGSDSFTGNTGMESLFLADGALTKKSKASPPRMSNSDLIPPRTIPRKNHESSIPAEEHPYYDFQPHLFNHSGNRCFDAPYHISSRIIIKDSGEVQFERNVMGNRPPKRHGGFHFKQDIPIPPRGIRATADSNGNVGSTCGNNLSWQTNFKFQSNTEAHLNGAQLSHQVDASINSSLDTEAPPIPPRPHRKSTSVLSSSSVSTNPPSTRRTCKSPVPLPRTTFTTSNNIKSSSHSEMGAGGTEYSSDEQQHLPNEMFADLSAEPTLTSTSKGETIPRQRKVFSQFRTISDSELGGYSYRIRDKEEGSQNSSLMKRTSVMSDASDGYVVPITPPLPLACPQSDSRHTLSPSYIDESQFLLQTSSPYYLRLVGVKDDWTTPPHSQLAQSIPTADSAIVSDYDDHGLEKREPLSSSSSLECDDKECDFEDAASIAYIQSTYRQRCTSCTSQCGLETSSVSLFATHPAHIQVSLGEGKQQRPEIPRRNVRQPTDRPKENGQNILIHVDTSETTNQETEQASCEETKSNILVSQRDRCVSASKSEGGDIKEEVKLKPVPHPRSKHSTKTTCLSCSDSNLFDSVNVSDNNLSVKTGQKSVSLCTNFFLDEMGIGISEL